MNAAAGEPSSLHDEDLRRALLLTLGILDTGPEAAFDGLTVAASVATGCPVAGLSLLDGERLWFKSSHGAGAEQVLRESALCHAAARGQGLFEVTDLLHDARFAVQQWPEGGPSLRYYAGVPVAVEGLAIGTLCVVDTQPRPALAASGRDALRGLAAAAEALMAARRPGAESYARALRRRQELLSRMSHEMRTPLNAVLGFSQLLQLDPALAGNAQAGAWLQQIEKASGHLLALVEEMLELARLEAGRQRLAPTRLDLAAVVRACAEMMAAQATAGGVQLVLEGHGGKGGGNDGTTDWGLLADDRALRQILINLIGNALQHSPRGSQVRLRLEARRHSRGVAVIDSGPGIAGPDLLRLFQPFERVGDSAGGTGLGLAISRQLAETLRGAIEVHSEVGVGSTFTLRLPAAAATVTPPSAPPPGGTA